MKFNFFKKIWGKKEPEEEKKEVKVEKEGKIEPQRGVEFNLIPLITEKTLKLSKEGKYTFLAPNSLNKIQIKKAIEKMFNVNVQDIQTMNYKKRLRGVTKIKSKRPSFKKAIVTLKPGQTIQIFE